MTRIKLAIIPLLLMLPFAAQAEKYVDYKCYLDTTAGEKVIYFSWLESKVKMRLANMVAKSVTIDKGHKARIRRAIECIQAKKKFKNNKAYLIDSKLLK